MLSASGFIQSYLCQTAFDTLSLTSIKKRWQYQPAILECEISFEVSISLGVIALTPDLTMLNDRRNETFSSKPSERERKKDRQPYFGVRV